MQDALPAVRSAEIEEDTALVTSETQVIGALTSNIRRTEGACIITLPGLLNFDDGRSQVSQDHRTVWPGQYTRKIDNYYIRENSFHGTSGWVCLPFDDLNISQQGKATCQALKTLFS